MSAYLARLRSVMDRPGVLRRAKDPVTAPAIRIWCEAVDDYNPAYQDPGWAAGSRFGGIIAPPTSLNMWTLPGNRRAHEAEPLDEITELLAERGFTSVAAVNNDHEYLRPVRPGDRLTQKLRIGAVSEEKKTALGRGHFVDLVNEYTTEDGALAGRTMMRILRWNPATGESVSPSAERRAPETPIRPPRRESTLTAREVLAGTLLRPWTVPVTQASIAALATATYDFNDVHLDRDAAHRRGARDVYMNILGSTGLVNCYLTDWAGPEALLTAIDVRLRAQNHPGDTLTLTGTVTVVNADGTGAVEVAVRGYNSLGDHIIARCVLDLPA